MQQTNTIFKNVFSGDGSLPFPEQEDTPLPAPSCDTGLGRQLQEIIQTADIKTVFQPIVSLRDGSVFGYEALSRGPVHSPLQNPDALFGVARECGMLWELEQLCRTKALENAYRQEQSPKLFLNVNPHVIHDEKFQRGFTKEYLRAFDIDPENIIFEITEKNAVDDIDAFKKTIENYKKQSYQIAIDDAGAGYSGLNMITDIHPHYIKLDMNLVRSIDSDSYKKALVKSLHDFCRLSNVHLIAEGIETLAELQTLIDIGVHYGQGYYIKRPADSMGTIDSGVLEDIRKHNAKRNHIYHHGVSNIYIGNLCCDNVTVHPDTLTQSVYNIFLENPLISGVSIVKNKTVCGIVTKTHINLMMSGQYGYSLYARRPISHIMNEDPLVVDYTTPIDTVSKLAMSRSAEHLYDYIIVTMGREYYGIVTIKALLEKTMEIEVSTAKHQNPLSGLPGNSLIQQRLEQCIEGEGAFTVLYFDLDNFKAYNDVYGFENGDRVLLLLTGIIKKYISAQGFAGHVGGDDFIGILSGHDVAALCTAMLGEFDSAIRSCYSDEDIVRGHIVAKNRSGVEEHFPIMTLSIACVTNQTCRFEDVYALAEKSSAVKKKCKQIWTSCFLVE